MSDDHLYVPQMLLIGSTGRNNGKTTLAVALIQKWKNHFPITVLKVTTILERDGECPRGGAGCGVCAQVKGNFELIAETNPDGNKDTSRLLAAGAEKVYWLKTFRDHIYDGIQAFMAEIDKHTLIICESNSLRKVVTPGIFIMLNNTGNNPIKKSAGDVMPDADLIINDELNPNMDKLIDKIEIFQEYSYVTFKIKPGFII